LRAPALLNVADLENLLKQRQDETRDRNRQVEDGVFAAINDPRHPRPVPVIEAIPPALNFNTGYGVKTMPGVRESIEQKQYGDADREIVRVAKALDRETALINAAASDLERIQK
jgi:hypothetical protein